ncbi:MAG: phosphatidylserine decarboxylase [Alphaproteobacteria bacterium]|nr:phosphatidylserine decarboxylase [Alphaproteobacteria bacterium]
MLRSVLVPIAPEGRPFVAGGVVLALVLLYLGPWTGAIGIALAGWVAYFFRDPPRVVPTREGLLVSPADGVISHITEAVPPPELELGAEPLTRVSVFLNVFDVHINRSPIAGTVERVAYHAGKFLNASLDKASTDNERNGLTLKIADGRKIGVVQIAGLVARRIVCHAREGQTLRTGERFGLIRFGSRTDVFLPKGIAPMVAIGQRMLGGETVMADLQSTEGPRRGEVQ